APVLGLAFGLLFLLLVPLVDVLLAAGRWSIPLGALLIALGLFADGALTTRYSEAHPKPSMMAYALDADSGKAVWASSTNRLDAWTTRYVGESATRGKLKGFYPDWLPVEFLIGPAPVSRVQPPEAQLLESSAVGDVRTIRLRVSSPRHAPTLSIATMEGT